MYREKKAITVALYGLLTALALVLSFVETLIPIPIPIPGVKLGLANLVTVVGLYLIGIPGTIAVTLVRIVLVGFSFGNPYSMIYGLSGSFLSLLVMAIFKKTGRFSQISISVLGGIAHNIGQITFAAVIVQTSGVFYYLPFLIAAGCIAGTLIGIVGGLITGRLLCAMRGIKK
ncbi:heptaprenyl diphosphate synthase [Clostridium sp. AM30-24]|nr:Gx transporter family protein [Clostridium sp. AM30-24]RHT38586.1 heptaprenyl diphosphate synthase [Clostridium sp. AM30-24]